MEGDAAGNRAGLIRLVVAGTHQEFLEWVASLDPSLRSLTHRPIYRHGLRGINAFDVEAFDWVGQYWLNPVWGSDEYREFMADGLRLQMEWAVGWTEDWWRSRERRRSS